MLEKSKGSRCPHPFYHWEINVSVHASTGLLARRYRYRVIGEKYFQILV